MKTQTALLLVLCVTFYRLAQLSLEDLSGYAVWFQSQAVSFASDPIAYLAGVYEILDKTGGLQWIVLAIAAKGLSWYFKRKRLARAAAQARVEAEKKK